MYREHRLLRMQNSAHISNWPCKKGLKSRTNRKSRQDADEPKSKQQSPMQALPALCTDREKFA
jgi:hypothetical protein